MPAIGKPSTLADQKFSKISMHKNRPPSGQTQDINRIVDKDNQGVKFVDAKEHNKMGKDGFLKLLTHQLKNQDPMKPMDQKQFSSDLAQFAQLEQLANMNTALQKQNDNAPIENKFYGATFLGKKVMTSGTTIDYKGGVEPADIPFNLPHDAKAVVVRIFDSQNQLIGQIEKNNVPRGQQLFAWDGVSLDNSKAAPGTYSVSVKAWDENFSEFKGETKSFGMVTGVSFKDGQTVLKLDGKKSIFLRDVESIGLISDNKNVPQKSKPSAGEKKTATEAYNKFLN